MSEFSPEYLQGWKDSVEAEQISGDRVSVLTFGLIGGFILGLIMLWAGRSRSDEAAGQLAAALVESEAQKLDRQAKAADEALADLERTAEAGLPGNLNPAPKPADLEGQAS